MASKELFERVAGRIYLNACDGKDEQETARDVLSLVFSSLLSPTDEMRQAYRDANCWPNEETIWQAMLNASPLGEQSE